MEKPENALEGVRRPHIRVFLALKQVKLLIVFLLLELPVPLFQRIAERPSSLRSGAHFAHSRADETCSAANTSLRLLDGRREDACRAWVVSTCLW